MKLIRLVLSVSLAFALPVVAAVGPRDFSFRKVTLTGEYWCDGVNAADIDGDGRNELLYVYWGKDMTAAGTTLYCFRPNGSVAWTFKLIFYSTES